MSLSVRFRGAPDGDDGPFSLASASGWALAGVWLSRVPTAYPALTRLLTDGEADDTSALASELDDALRRFPPENPKVGDTLGHLRWLVGSGDPREAAEVIG